MSGIGAMALLGVDVPAVMSILGGSVIAPLAKGAVAFPLVYHYLAGVRHLMWDFQPDTLDNKQVEKSSWILLASSAALTLPLLIL
jgi:succinate dehydrogenase/fumarate reductase cytochrome b subunit